MENNVTERRKRKKPKKGWGLLIAAGSLLVLLVLLICCLPDEKPAEQPPVDQTQGSTQQGGAQPEGPSTLNKGDIVQTPYGTFSFSQQWVGSMHAMAQEDDGYVVTFYGTVAEQELELFHISFGVLRDNTVGYLTGTDGQIYVSLQLNSTIDRTKFDAQQLEKLDRMSEEINVIARQIYELPTFIPGMPGQEQEQTFHTATTYGELELDSKWASYFRTKVISDDTAETVTFYADLNGSEIMLFAVSFNALGPGTYHIGDLQQDDGSLITVGIDVFPVRAADWKEAQQDTVTAMQEEVNSIREQIGTWQGFVPCD